MRRYLNNPWVVLGLCGVAIMILYLNADDVDVQQVIPQQILSGGQSLVPEVDPLPIEKTTIDLTQLDWPTSLKRDPFASISHRAADTQETEGKDGQQISGLDTSPDSAPSLRLTAVVLDPEPKVAMINRKLVAEGDRIEGLQVARIESTGVWLNGPSGSQHLGFGATSGNSPTVERPEEVSPRDPERANAVKRPRRETSLIDGRDCSRSSTCS